MKTKNFLVMSIAAAAMTLASCQKEDVSKIEDCTPVTLHITANTDATRSVFGDKVDGVYSVKWTDDKQVEFSLNETTPVGVTPVVINDGANASFEVTFTEGGETGTVYAFSPMGVHNNTNPAPGFTGITSKYDDVFLNIPSEQTPLANSCDQSAQALFASQDYNGSDTEINMTFNHVVAYGKMAIKNFTGTISKVDIVFPVAVCGTSCYFYYDGTKKGTIENATFNTITLNPDNVVDNVFWFACAPTAGAIGEMKIIVTDSDDKTYTKAIDLTTKALPFTQGKVSSFGVNMDGIEADENIQVIPDGDYAILAKDGDDYYAVSTDANATSTRRDRVSVTYNGGKSFETTNAKLIWSFAASGDTYTIANGTDYMGAGKNIIPLKTETNAAEVTIVDNGNGTYTLTADCGIDGTRYMAMNGANGFAWYASTTGVNSLYLVPASYTVPTLYNISVGTTANGTVTPSQTQASAGETITLTVTPDSGYTLATLTCNGADITSAKSFVMPAEDVTIAATFEEASSVKYVLCTSISDLVSGSHYIITNGTSGEVNCISNVSNSNNRKAVAATASEFSIVVPDGSTIMTFTLDGEAGAWTLQTDNYAGTNGYLASASSGKNNYCRVIEDETTCTISFSGNEAIIKLAPHTERNILRYNPNSGSPLFACYSSGQNPIYLYKKQ